MTLRSATLSFASLAKERIETLLASEERPGDPAVLALELEDLQNYLQQVQRYKTDPVVKPSIVHGYCVGQTLSLCEIVDGQPKLVYRFVTSSRRDGALLPARQELRLGFLDRGGRVRWCSSRA